MRRPTSPRLLKTWGVKPLGDDRTYFESVKFRGYKVTRNSSVDRRAPNGSRDPFKHGDHVTFPAGPGGHADTHVHRRRVRRLRADRRSEGSRRQEQARDLDAEPRSCQPAEGAAAGAEEPLAITNYRARAAIGFAPAAEPDSRRAGAHPGAGGSPESDRRRPAGAGAAAGARARGRRARPWRRDSTGPHDRSTVDALATPQFTGDETFFERALRRRAGRVCRDQGESRQG